MKLLLDTHIWIWSLVEPDRLSRQVQRQLFAPRTERWLSPISVWELLQLCRKGRIELDEEPPAWAARGIRALGLIEAPVTNEVALESGRVELPHRDPADAFLVATARVYGLTLVTADARLLGLKEIPLLSNL